MLKTVSNNSYTYEDQERITDSHSIEILKNKRK